MLADTEMEAKEKEAEHTNSTLPEAEAAPLCRFSPMSAFEIFRSVVFLIVSRLFSFGKFAQVSTSKFSKVNASDVSATHHVFWRLRFT